MKKFFRLAVLFSAIFLLAVSCNPFQSKTTQTPPPPPSFVPPVGAVRSFVYQGVAGQNAMAMLKQLHKVETKDFGGGMGEFVESIAGIKPGADEFWAFYVNGKSSNVGASSYTMKEGDLIEWKLEKIQN